MKKDSASKAGKNKLHRNCFLKKSSVGENDLGGGKGAQRDRWPFIRCPEKPERVVERNKD